MVSYPRPSILRVTDARGYWKYTVQFIFVFAAYFIAGKLGQATANVRSNNLGPVWPAYGVALAAILLCGYRIWPAVSLGIFVVAFLSPESYLTALGQDVGSTTAALIGASLLRHVAKFDNNLSRLRDVFAIILLGAFGSAIVSSLIGTLVLHASHINSYAGLGSEWLIYWLGDSTGVLLMTPLVLTFPSLLRLRNWGRVAEFGCLLTILIAICAVVFGDLSIVPVRMVAFAVLPLILWAAIRFGVSGAALSIFLVATVATVQTAVGSGSFTHNTPFMNGVQLDVFFAVLSLTGLTFAAVYAERELAQREREQSIREQVGMEVRLQNQELLRRHEERLRLAQQAAEIGTFEWNIQTGTNNWTPELEAMYGLAPGTFAGTQGAFENLLHPDDCDRVKRLVELALRTGKPGAGEWRVVWPDGSLHWIAGRWQLFKDQYGAPLRLIGVNVDITDRKRVEQTLRESEQRLRLATQVGRMYAFEWDAITDVVSRSSEHLKRLGFPESLSGHQQRFVDTIHPGDRAKYLAAVAGLTPDNPIAEVTYRMLASDGTLIWLKSSGRGFFDDKGKLLRVIGMTADVTDVKQAEESLADMTRKLINSQEQERKRIGRELHDDINQRLALISVEMEMLQESPSELQSRVPELRKELRQISDDVQAISHDLHSSKLEILGSVAGMKSWCREIAERHKIQISFSGDLSSSLPLDLGLPLFRILQQAVDNAIKHSGEKRIEVQLREDRGEIHLIVRDSGKGFNVENALRDKGLGLTSMRERVRLVNGTISIQSQPMNGTTIYVSAPLGSEAGCQEKAG